MESVSPPLDSGLPSSMFGMLPLEAGGHIRKPTTLRPPSFKEDQASGEKPHMDEYPKAPDMGKVLLQTEQRLLELSSPS